MRVLIANRGEIAVRIIRACHELGYKGVAVYTEVDRAALHVRLADEAVSLGESNQYLNPRAIVEAALKCKVDAVHPGYGFLSENSEFARLVEEAGMVFVGPRPETIELTGNKLTARRAAKEAGLPVLFGSEMLPREIPVDLARQIHYPVLVKATAGGGGRGIRMVSSESDLQEMVEAARLEALAAFGNDEVYLETLVNPARHLEVQILGDGQGHFLCLGERECSIQRRRQKLIEESPAYNLPPETRQAMHEGAMRLAQGLDYRSLGTVEFLLDEQGMFHFMEINPRIQVEHPVTELVTGIDLIRVQLELAAGKPLRYAQDRIEMRGAAIEARVLAEDTENGFLPVTGKIGLLKEPGGPGIRVDSALYPGMEITADYDSLLAKVIAWDEDRQAATRRLQRALREFQIGGVLTDLQFLLQIIENPRFVEGRVDTTFLDGLRPLSPQGEPVLERDIALAAALLTHHRVQRCGDIDTALSTTWRQVAWREQIRGN